MERSQCIRDICTSPPDEMCCNPVIVMSVLMALGCWGDLGVHSSVLSVKLESKLHFQKLNPDQSPHDWSSVCTSVLEVFPNFNDSIIPFVLLDVTLTFPNLGIPRMRRMCHTPHSKSQHSQV